MKVSEEEAIKYLDSLNIDKNEYICEDCGKLALWKNSEVSIVPSDRWHNIDYSKKKFKRIAVNGTSFQSPRRTYNGIEYHLHYCYDCACKRFPEIPNKHFPLQPASLRSKFLYKIPDDVFSSITSKVCKRTKEKYINRFGEEEGNRRWKSYCDKQSISNTFEYKREKFGWSREQFDEYNKSRSCTLENFIKRYGEENGIKKWKDYCEIQRYTTTLEYFKKTYGDEEGTKKYEAFQIAKAPATLGLTGASEIANEMFKELSEYYKGNTIYTECINKEWIVDYRYSLDYYDKTLNVVVEFYGDFWHCNPNKYQIDEAVKFPNSEIVFPKEIWDKDKKRQDYIEKKLNTHVFIVWEDDYRKNKKKTIESLIERINKFVKNNELIN